MLKRRTLFFGILALSLGLCGAFFNQRWLESRSFQNGDQQVEKIAETVPVVIVKHELPVGELVRSLQLATVDWPIELTPKGTFRSVEEVVDRVPRRALAEGEPVLESTLLPSGTEAGLSPIIAAGKRAVAVKVDEVIGIAGFIKPGAMVDVLATIRERRGAKVDAFSKVILQGVKVLAIDQSLERHAEGNPELVSVVTLEVSPVDAQKLAFAAHEGKLQLALRNPSDEDEVATRSVNAGALRGTAGARRARSSVEVIKGLDVSNKRF